MHDKVSKDAAGSEGSAALPMRSCKRPGACAARARGRQRGRRERREHVQVEGEKFGVS